MHNNDITVDTAVYHKDGGTYRLHAVGGSGDDITTVNIIKVGFGHCFLGSPQQAREQGFLFGDDGTEPTCDVCGAHEAEQEWCGNCGCCLIHCQKHDGCEPETWEDKDARIAELGEQIDTLTATISDLRGEALAREETFTSLRARATAAARELDTFRDQVFEAVKGARKEHDLCIDGCNSFLEGLGLPKISKTWKVTVTRDSDYETVLTVSGVEADDEDDARDKVKDNFTVSATVRRVDYDYDYTGDGDTDWDHEDYSDTDSDDDGDDFADAHRDAFTFVVEEA
jgi:hypothetical protein